MVYLFQLFYFKLTYVVESVVCVLQRIYMGHIFFIKSVNLGLLIIIFRTFIFKDIYTQMVLKSIILLFILSVLTALPSSVSLFLYSHGLVGHF